ncbi:WcaI family glycosyltransferase [Aliiroseovarius crassostreae]|uniref:WcaI family glycosyltransferase n=1 Tax=Aliiroseovarius crassostreae TaxID=154981 RepID=UPI0021AFF513|nr:WcaI family glycosyltransferase [Aliiroseovarius crassostreae]UWQ04624.1 WcaI family glycosyltransferase [Aliiroseovarius crassostreae]
MKIHILGLNFDPETIGTAVYTTGLAENLVSRGHQVVVTTAHPYYPQWKRRAGWPRWSYHTKTPRDGLRITHCPLYVPARPSGLARILHYLSFALSSAPRVGWSAFRDRPDVMFVVAPSLVSAVTGWAVARLTGAKLWLHIQDFEVEAAFATNVFSPNSHLGRLALRFERWVLHRFDRISTISQPMLEKLREKGVSAATTYELRNWANIARVSVLDGPSPMREALGIKHRFVAYYSGNIAAKQGLEIIPDAARLLKNRRDLLFVICGEGAFLKELQQRAVDLDNIRFLPLQPLEQLSDALGMADLHLLPQIEAVEELVLPSKLTNMLASGRPVLATTQPNSALAQEIKGAGHVTPPGDAPAFAEAIETLLDRPDLRAHMGKTARQHALDRWNMQAILDGLENALQDLIHTHPHSSQHPADHPNTPRDELT